MAKLIYTKVFRKLPLVTAALLLFTGCAKTFLVSKECTTYYFGSQNQKFVNLLCASGDLQRVLSDAGLPEDSRARLYEAQCTERSREKLNGLYAALGPEQQEALKSAFRKNGYEINAKPAPNYQVYPYYDNVNFCPPEQY